ncbi:interleukin-20-like isoform X2 [Lathamus discolor]
MKGSHLFLCLFFILCWLNLMPTAGNRIFHFGHCRVSMSMTEIRLGFTAIKTNIVSNAPHSHRGGEALQLVAPEAPLEPACPSPSLCCPMQQARDPIRTLSILSHPHSLHKVKSSDRCCITRHLFNFYVDKVFKHCKTEDSYINRKISSIANSFLSMKRTLRQCHEQNKCMCGEESTEKFKQILANYEGLNVTSAAMKSLGELDILLDWMEKSQRAEGVNNPPKAGAKEAAGTLHTPVMSGKAMCCTTAESP